MDERLRELVRKWRAQELEARQAEEAGHGREWRSEARVLKDCADDLANALTDIHTTPAPALTRTVGEAVGDEITQPLIDPPKWIHAKNADEIGNMTTEGYMYWGDGLFMLVGLGPEEMKEAYEEAMRELKGREP